ncbi:MAG: HNH endonuclease [Bdellovibrionota bacterium]
MGSGGRRCESRYALEIDHILPVAHGGSHAPENLRVLCRAHNLQQAVEKLGPEVMKNFIPSLRTRTKQNASEHGPLAFPK